MPLLLRGALAAAAVLLAPSAAAQDQPESQIVVTGKRDVEQEVADFVAALTPSGAQGQLSRFETDVCPGAAGFAPAQSQAMVDRMRKVARAADLDPGKPGCLPNILVLATRDKRVLIETLASRHPHYFAGLPKSEVRRLARSPGPAAAWHLPGRPRGADGAELAPEGFGMGSTYVNRTTTTASRINAAARPQTIAAVVVIETRALDGLSTTQVADYAAMRTLLRADPSKLADSSTPTILKVLETPMGSEMPLTLTNWDMGMLRAYYDSPPNRRANAQRSEMRRQLGKSLDAGAKD